MANYKITKRIVKNKEGKVIGEKNCIIVDVDKVTDGEWKIITMYAGMGYKVEERKEKKKTTGKGVTKAELLFYMTKERPEIMKTISLKQGYMELQKEIRIKLYGITNDSSENEKKKSMEEFKALKNAMKVYAENNKEEFEIFEKKLK